MTDFKQREENLRQNFYTLSSFYGLSPGSLLQASLLPQRTGTIFLLQQSWGGGPSVVLLPQDEVVWAILCRVNRTGTRDLWLGSLGTWVLLPSQLLTHAVMLHGHYPPWASVSPSIRWGLGSAWDHYIFWCLARVTGQSTVLLLSTAKWLTWETNQ